MTSFSIKNTLLYKKRMEEINHIEKNKWYMSERVGKDIGWERALLDWVINKKKYLNIQ